jgi:hypothetical protein
MTRSSISAAGAVLLLGLALAGCRSTPHSGAMGRVYTPPPEPPETIQVRRAPDQPPETFHARTVHHLAGFQPVENVRYSRFGGLLDRRAAATGFFRTERLGDRWWIIDPDGHPFLHLAVVTVRPGGSEGQRAAFQRKFGSEERWIEQTTTLLRSAGFNGAGNWSRADLIRQSPQPLVYTVYINPMNRLRNLHREEHGGVYHNAGWQGYEHDLILVFDPRFERIVDEMARELAVYRDDPYLLGYFSDNELPFKNDALDRHLIHLEHDDPGHQAARAWLDARRGPGVGIAELTEDDRQAFLGFYAERYYETVARAIRSYDPNHLFLGSRFNQEREELRSRAIFEAAGRHADIVSVNVYRVWEPGQERLRNWAAWSGRPVMVTEWYTKGADTGLPNVSGAGWIVPTQRDRGLFYQNFALELLRSGVTVGWHWFMYQDNDPSDLTTDPSNRDSNKGIVTSEYEPYEALLDEMRELNAQVYPLIEYFDRPTTSPTTKR